MKHKAGGAVWVDLTDMIVWRGHFTGIQRVVHSYATRFAEDGARFFVFDHVDKRHVEVGADFLNRNDEEQTEPVLSRRQQIKRTIAKPYYALPDRSKALLSPGVRVANKVARTTISKALGKKAVFSPFRASPDADFQHGDTAVLIGAGWNEAGSLEALCTIRAEKGIRLVQHINDILPVYQPQLFADELPKIFNPYVELAIRNADVITVISEATKRDVLIFCSEIGIKAPKIEVVRLGEDVNTNKAAKPHGVPFEDNFVLSVGTFEIRKNYILLYQAAKLAQLEGRDFPNIVIAGRKGWLTEDLAHVVDHDPFTHGKIVWLPDVSDEGLEWLYSHCMFFVFPSLCEGWGLPIVEALQHGKMSLASNVSSMLEIGDGAVDYFSPYDARSCMDKILEYASSSTYEAANKNVKKTHKVFTWDESYKSFQKAVFSSGL